MQIEVELPDMGDEVGDEATVTEWFVEEGDHVEEGEVLMEVAVDDASFEVPSPTSGVVLEMLVDEEDAVHVGDTIALLEGDESILSPDDFLEDEE